MLRTKKFTVEYLEEFKDEMSEINDQQAHPTQPIPEATTTFTEPLRQETIEQNVAIPHEDPQEDAHEQSIAMPLSTGIDTTASAVTQPRQKDVATSPEEYITEISSLVPGSKLLSPRPRPLKENTGGDIITGSPLETGTHVGKITQVAKYMLKSIITVASASSKAPKVFIKFGPGLFEESSSDPSQN